MQLPGRQKIKKKTKVTEAISTVQNSQLDNVQRDTQDKQVKNTQQKLNKIIKAKQQVSSAEREALRSGVTNVGL